MRLLRAGLLRQSGMPCLACGAPAGVCWCAGAPTDPRHDEGALVGLPLPLAPPART